MDLKLSGNKIFRKVLYENFALMFSQDAFLKASLVINFISLAFECKIYGCY